MNIIGKTESLASALNLVAPISRSKTTLPILSCVLLRAKEEKVTIEANDLDRLLRIEVEGVDIKEDGACSIPADKFQSALSSCGEDFGIVLKAGAVMIDSDNCKVKLMVLTEEEFPVAFQVDEPALDLPLSFFAGIKATESACVRDPKMQRPMLMGIHFDEGRIVATDGRRMHLYETDIKIKGQTLPEGSIKYLGIFSESPCKCGITGEGNFLAIKSEKALFITKMLDSSFPNYKQMIPEDEKKTVKLNKSIAESLTACARVETVVRFDIGKKAVTLSARNSAGDEITLTHPCKGNSELSIIFNPFYVIDAVRACESEEAEFHFKDAIHAAKMKCGPLTAVLLPIRTEIKENEK